MNDPKSKDLRSTGTARSLRLERVRCNGIQYLAFRDSRGALRDYSTGVRLKNTEGNAPVAVAYFF